MKAESWQTEQAPTAHEHKLIKSSESSSSTGFNPVIVSPGPVETAHSTIDSLEATTDVGNFSLLVVPRDADGQQIKDDRQAINLLACNPF